MTINILHLYPREMNLYGDHGNVLALKQRAIWRGFDVKVIEHHVGDPIPKDIDIIFGGGGQDSGQVKIEEDLRANGDALKAKIEDGTPSLVICGLYQLFGRYFLTSEGKEIRGIGIFDAVTVAGSERLIGNIVIQSERFGEVVGYENHSGLTMPGEGAKPFGTVLKGAGNNGSDGTEGILYRNCIGTYLHGPILPKNPAVADFLLLEALKRKDPSIAALQPLDDTLEMEAHRSAASRPR